MDYKDTLLLPTTDFPMRGNLPENEPQRYKNWFEARNVYKKMIKNREGAQKSFTLHDGPPYANGNIHIGHALNKILKDIIVKTHYFRGEKVRYVPGWDCHGLPIEQQVEKNLGDKKAQTSVGEIRELCREHAQKFVNIQRDEFKTLGVVGDWENPYLTMNFAFEAQIYRALCEIAKKGLLVQRSKPVYWSWAAKSALAEAEVEYAEKEDWSVYVAFDLGAKALEAIGAEAAKIVIWTTTPWTLPANVAIAMAPENEYVLSSCGYVVAKERFEKLKEIGALKGEIAKIFSSKILEGKVAKNPLNDRDSLLILGDHVSMEDGSGCVHTAPGHGEEDYKIGLKYGLEVIMPVDEGGKYDESVVGKKLFKNPQEFVGEHIFKANDKIVELLGDALIHSSKFVHSYPFCWRTHKPVIYRATKQWFVAMDEEGSSGVSLREKALSEIEGVRFYPAMGINRLRTMIENRPDWCISRQRDWGVPIAFFKNKKTGEIVLDEKVLNFIAFIFEQKGCDAWWEMEIKDLLYPASGLNPDDLEKTSDILDVWFDSGSTWKAVLKSQNYDAGEYPASMYLEGSDQHRGWFQSSLLVSTACMDRAPYEKILTHGFTVDEKGEKMSKSKGNVVAPQEIAKKYGVEILRLWVGMSDYRGDLKISENIIKNIAEQYRKIRNTFRFLLANANDLEEIMPIEKMGSLDKWILSEAKKVFDEASALFAEYDFSKALQIVTHFITVDLSGIYLDISKDRLYCDGKNSQSRLSAQSAMALIAQKMMALFAPILTYTIDEIMEYAPKAVKAGANGEVAMDAFDLLYAPFEEIESDFDAPFLKEAREKFFEIVDRLKKEKKIKSTLELVLHIESDKTANLKKTDLEDWFTVSKILSHKEEAIESFEIEGGKFAIILADRHKCPRCWKLKAHAEDALCKRCDGVLNG